MIAHEVDLLVVDAATLPHSAGSRGSASFAVVAARHTPLDERALDVAGGHSPPESPPQKVTALPEHVESVAPSLAVVPQCSHFAWAMAIALLVMEDGLRGLARAARGRAPKKLALK